MTAHRSSARRADGWEAETSCERVQHSRLIHMVEAESTPLFEGLTLQFRAEAFNLFNHPQFGPPDTALGDNTTGTVSSQVNAPRELQFALKLLF